jgi:hypothetical protein
MPISSFARQALTAGTIALSSVTQVNAAGPTIETLDAGLANTSKGQNCIEAISKIARERAAAKHQGYHFSLAMGKSTEPGKVQSCGWYNWFQPGVSQKGAMDECAKRSQPGTCKPVINGYQPAL